MRKVAIAVVVGIVGLLAFNFVTTGEITLVPSFGVPEDERPVADLEDRLAAARREFSQAHRVAGMSGTDTTASVEAARREVGRVDRELRALKGKLTTDGARERAARLAEAVEEFKALLR